MKKLALIILITLLTGCRAKETPVTRPDNAMDNILLELLTRLEEIGEDHEEIYDSEVRDRMGDVILHGFLIPREGYELPDDFGMFTDEANPAIKQALADYVRSASQEAKRIGLSSPLERLNAFQNNDVASPKNKEYFDDFFGWRDPDKGDWKK